MKNRSRKFRPSRMSGLAPGYRDARRELLPKLEELYRLSGYFNRWNNQIQKRVRQLSF